MTEAETLSQKIYNYELEYTKYRILEEICNFNIAKNMELKELELYQRYKEKFEDVALADYHLDHANSTNSDSNANKEDFYVTFNHEMTVEEKENIVLNYVGRQLATMRNLLKTIDITAYRKHLETYPNEYSFYNDAKPIVITEIEQMLSKIVATNENDFSDKDIKYCKLYNYLKQCVLEVK